MTPNVSSKNENDDGGGDIAVESTTAALPSSAAATAAAETRSDTGNNNWNNKGDDDNKNFSKANTSINSSIAESLSSSSTTGTEISALSDEEWNKFFGTGTYTQDAIDEEEPALTFDVNELELHKTAMSTTKAILRSVIITANTNTDDDDDTTTTADNTKENAKIVHHGDNTRTNNEKLFGQSLYQYGTDEETKEKLIRIKETEVFEVHPKTQIYVRPEEEEKEQKNEENEKADGKVGAERSSSGNDDVTTPLFGTTATTKKDLDTEYIKQCFPNNLLAEKKLEKKKKRILDPNIKVKFSTVEVKKCLNLRIEIPQKFQREVWYQSDELEECAQSMMKDIRYHLREAKKNKIVREEGLDALYVGPDITATDINTLNNRRTVSKTILPRTASGHTSFGSSTSVTAAMESASSIGGESATSHNSTTSRPGRRPRSNSADSSVAITGSRGRTRSSRSRSQSSSRTRSGSRGRTTCKPPSPGTQAPPAYNFSDYGGTTRRRKSHTGASPGGGYSSLEQAYGGQNIQSDYFGYYKRDREIKEVKEKEEKAKAAKEKAEKKARKEAEKKAAKEAKKNKNKNKNNNKKGTTTTTTTKTTTQKQPLRRHEETLNNNTANNNSTEKKKKRSSKDDAENDKDELLKALKSSTMASSSEEGEAGLRHLLHLAKNAENYDKKHAASGNKSGKKDGYRKAFSSKTSHGKNIDSWAKIRRLKKQQS